MKTSDGKDNPETRIETGFRDTPTAQGEGETERDREIGEIRNRCA